MIADVCGSGLCRAAVGASEETRGGVDRLGDPASSVE